MMEDNNKLRPDQWSDLYNPVAKFRCQMPVEYDDERKGPFRLFRQDCSYKQHSYEVRDQNGDLLQRFKDLKSAQNDINERYEQVLKNQSDLEFQRLKNQQDETT